MLNPRIKITYYFNVWYIHSKTTTFRNELGFLNVWEPPPTDFINFLQNSLKLTWPFRNSVHLFRGGIKFLWNLILFKATAASWHLNPPQLEAPQPLANISHQNPNLRFIKLQAFSHSSEGFCLKLYICAFEYKEQTVMENCVQVNFNFNVTSFNLHLNEESNGKKQRSPN
jgi:hypothetical protein